MGKYEKLKEEIVVLVISNPSDCVTELMKKVDCKGVKKRIVSKILFETKHAFEENLLEEREAKKLKRKKDVVEI